MIQERQVVLFRFPQTNGTAGKLRPAVVVRKVPGPHDDWLICMISSQVSQEVPDFDEIVSKTDDDFILSGLKQPSLIRIARLAVVEADILFGAIGEIGTARLARIKSRLSEWLLGR
ncbi:MAG: type II toxin-antitoxin system PemK/MazF family toxin [Thermodesulfobacteriota bacterium]